MTMGALMRRVAPSQERELKYWEEKARMNAHELSLLHRSVS